MSDITIPVKIPQTGTVSFTFTPKAILDLDKPIPDSEFGGDGAISLLDIKASASKDFSVGNNQHKIGFSASGGGLAALGIYRKTDRLFDDLGSEGLGEKLIELLDLKIKDTENLFALRWGYEIGGGVNAATALGPVTVTFGGSGKHTALSAILRLQDRGQSLRDSLGGTIGAWRAPRQIVSVDNLAPKSYAITETTGTLKFSIGAKYGFDYSWSKEELKLGALSGDIGLKIEAGIKAAFDAHFSGRFAIVLSRPDESRKLRIQIFRAKQRGWGFAFDAGVSAQASIGFPTDISELIKGIFNIHGLQVLEDFEKWVLSEEPLEELLGEALVDYANGLVTAATGVDVIETATELIREALRKWHALPAEFNGLIYKLIEEAIDLGPLTDFLRRIIDLAGDDEELAGLIDSKLREVGFEETPVGRFLEKAAKKGVLSLIANIAEQRDEFVSIAEKVLGILDGSTTEKILRNLQKLIDERLGLDKLENLDVDDWLKQRLSALIGKVPGTAELNKARLAVQKIYSRANLITEKAKKILEQKYSVELGYKYQTATSKTALVDVEVDFDLLEAKKAEAIVRDLINGELDIIFSSSPIQGLTLNKGVLTHETKRRSHFEINTTFGKFFIDHINNSLATAEAVDRDGNRVILFSLDAEDIRKKQKTISKLAISAKLSQTVGIRDFETESLGLRYQYTTAKKNAEIRFADRRLESTFNNYLLGRIPAERTFQDYLVELDKAADGTEDKGLGNLIASFEATLPEKTLDAFLDLPTDLTDQFYKDASHTVQQALRTWVPTAYVYNPESQYNDVEAIYPMLVWASIPIENKRIKDGVYHWEFRNSVIRQQRLGDARTLANLRKLIAKVLPEVPGNLTDRYKHPENILSRVLNSTDASETIFAMFSDLCNVEREILEGLAACAKAMRGFKGTADPQKKLAFLEDFGSEFTETFNNDIGGEYAGKGLRPLGVQLVADLARLIDGTIDQTPFKAMLEMIVVENSVSFDAEKYVNGTRPKPGEIKFSQRIISA
ncbi:MAG: hypothetical protein R2684_09040 [Pyrinomonadaceae bacterium]